MTETRSRKSASWLLIWMTLKTMSKTFLWLVGRSKTRLNTAIIPKISVKHAILWPWLLYYFTTWSIVLWARRGTAPELYRSPWQAVKPIGMSHIPPIPHPYNPSEILAAYPFIYPNIPSSCRNSILSWSCTKSIKSKNEISLFQSSKVKGTVFLSCTFLPLVVDDTDKCSENCCCTSKW